MFLIVFSCLSIAVLFSTQKLISELEQTQETGDSHAHFKGFCEPASHLELSYSMSVLDWLIYDIEHAVMPQEKKILEIFLLFCP